MNNLYKIAKSDKAVLKVFYDEDSESPREWDNLGTMVCWHRNYDLGDKHSYNDPNEFLKCMSEELIGYEDEGFIKEKADTFMTKYKIAKSTAYENGYSILEDGIIFDDGYNTVEDCEDELQDIRGHYIDEVYDDMSNDELLKLAEKKAIILPLFLYDHSGITMSTGDFGDRWDSGQVGWIYCTKERFMKETGYSEDELFSTDVHRTPNTKDHVKLKGHEDKSWDGFGQVISIGNDMITVDFDYNKIQSAKKAENVVTVSVNDIIEVMSNRAVEMLIGEVKTYDQYLRGDVYGFQLEKAVKCECCNHVEYEDIENCWGFYGDDDVIEGIKDSIPDEYQYLLNELKYAM